MVLGANTNGTLSFTLEEGPLDNYFIVNFIVNIIDSNGGITSYVVPNGVVSNRLNPTNFATLYNHTLKQITSSDINKAMHTLHYQYMPQTVTTFVSVLNRLATLEKCTSKFQIDSDIMLFMSDSFLCFKTDQCLWPTSRWTQEAKPQSEATILSIADSYRYEA